MNCILKNGGRKTKIVLNMTTKLKKVNKFDLFEINLYGRTSLNQQLF